MIEGSLSFRTASKGTNPARPAPELVGGQLGARCVLFRQSESGEYGSVID